MTNKVKCFTVKGYYVDDDDLVSSNINKKLEELGIDIDNVISIIQPGGTTVTKVFYKIKNT